MINAEDNKSQYECDYYRVEQGSKVGRFYDGELLSGVKEAH